MKNRRYVILDRDGTINEEVEYLADPGDLRLLPGAVEGLRRMQELGLGLLVATNQSGVARGYFTALDVDRVHQRLTEILAAEGVSIEGIYYCPHAPDEGCRCRKPLPGMVLEAAERHGFLPALGFVIGDKPSDIALGRSVSSSTLLVRTGYGSNYDPAHDPEPDYVVDNLAEAAEIIEVILRRLTPDEERCES